MKYLTNQWYTIACLLMLFVNCQAEFVLAKCEPIRIEMCRNIGYNETCMPNLVGNELQSEVDYILQTFSPLIEYMCSSQLKLFLCATYVPMCTQKVPIPIGPCRKLCESVRSRCHPILQGFGYTWPPALDCSRFPKENNHETMCMEGPGENYDLPTDFNSDTTVLSTDPSFNLDCLRFSQSYVKLHQTGRCVPFCQADILFGQNEKSTAEYWIYFWIYIALCVAILTILFSCIRSSKDQIIRSNQRRFEILLPMMWCYIMVVVGWTVRLLAGRVASSCGIDPQLPNVLLLLVDGLSNIACTSIFFLRYYFGMAAHVWWAVLCLEWHRIIRRRSLDCLGDSMSHIAHNGSNVNKIKQQTSPNITHNHLARFVAWGLPAFQSVAIIVTHLVDADELLGACFVGNQSDKGMQIFVATPFFCYWIFGSMNLCSGYLVRRRNRKILKTSNSLTLPTMVPVELHISGLFLFLYCIAFGFLLLDVIYEFANIDIWLNLALYNRYNKTLRMESQTPMWPFLFKAILELAMAIFCFAWILNRTIFPIKKKKCNPANSKNCFQQTGMINMKQIDINRCQTSIRIPISGQYSSIPSIQESNRYPDMTNSCQSSAITSSNDTRKSKSLRYKNYAYRKTEMRHDFLKTCFSHTQYLEQCNGETFL